MFIRAKYDGCHGSLHLNLECQHHEKLRNKGWLYTVKMYTVALWTTMVMHSYVYISSGSQLMKVINLVCCINNDVIWMCICMSYDEIDSQLKRLFIFNSLGSLSSLWIC